jgi:excinuclease ABC subunit B
VLGIIMPLFNLQSNYSPTGDQPQAIEKLSAGLEKGFRDQTLLGVTGSGKTFTMANLIAREDRPTLIISHNKTLAAQLYSEFKQYFPDAAVHYFVSYYDYYQPEAYIPQTDTYIEKETQINEEIDRLRHAATQSLINRRDVIIVASVSCIYGLGEREEYVAMSKKFSVGQKIKRNDILRELVQIQYERNDTEILRGQFRVRGENLDIHLATGEAVVRIILMADTIEKIKIYNINPGEKIPVWGRDLSRAQGVELNEIIILPAKHFMTPAEKMKVALVNIRAELETRLKELKKQGKEVEAYRLDKKTRYDLEMIETIGYCNGIENYSRHLSGRAAGMPPATLIDFFPSDYLMFIDESHVTLPQIGGMYFGDRARKDTLIEFGFRLPSARDNRPLTFEEFEKKVNQVIYVSATPREYEFKNSKQVVEQIIRPTGLLDPEVEVRPNQGSIENLLGEIRIRADRNQRVLVTTLTKRMAEELADFLAEAGIRVKYLHGEVETFDRVALLRELREGGYDCLVGVNLLREGLDLPEVSLIAILDADMSGFLRNETSLIQTMGRAARHEDGRVIMYADKITPAMKFAIDETRRRRRLQEKYNREHNITPRRAEAKFHEPLA